MAKQYQYTKTKEIFSKEKELPKLPGVYKFYDENNKILYIGKAKSLSNRLKSYLSLSKDRKKNELIDKIKFLEIFITKTESDALLLEQNLIRKLKPPFNVQFRDDKSFPAIYFSSGHDFPGIYLTRNKKLKGIKLGPYANVTAARQSIDLTRTLFGVRNCSDMVFQNRTRPCIQHQIGKCSAPCVEKISQKNYLEEVDAAIKFIEGKDKSFLNILYSKMDEYSSIKEFERAALYRDKIKAYRDIQKDQSVFTIYDNAVAITKKSNEYVNCISILEIKDGWLSNTENYFSKKDKYVSEDELMESFLSKILIEKNLENLTLLSDFKFSNLISQLKDKKINLEKKNSKNKKIFELASLQSNDGLQRQFNYPWITEGLSFIEDKTCSKINRIEGFDVSHLSGDNVTASCVVFDREGPQKKQYRTFNIKINKNDDYLAMKEVLSRRLKRLQKDGNNFPDLIVIDGGKGQLSSAIKEVEKYEDCSTKILSLVKGPDRNSKYDDILYFHEGKILRMDLENEGKRLLQFVRDESHRFALSRSKKRRKNITHSTLDEIKGIGSKNKKVLLRHFGGIESLRKASIDQIKSIQGIGSMRAKLIYDHFNEQ
ncbi:excinuclease ABC subunit UvrC [SAR86 cluster bacterium]|nr:excinuclease ABC subunit UvrC [SAR86 cluster bacterium]